MYLYIHIEYARIPPLSILANAVGPGREARGPGDIQRPDHRRLAAGHDHVRRRGGDDDSNINSNRSKYSSEITEGSDSNDRIAVIVSSITMS